MTTIFQAFKKRKQQTKVYAFHAFADPSCSVDYSGPFRDNIRSFLKEYAEIEEYNAEGMPTWCTLLLDEGSGIAVPLYVVEENVKHCSRPFCDYCRCVGWSHHFVSKLRYHIVIPADSDWDQPLTQKIFFQQNHLLHGLIHCNGFGHLLCINGREGGSKFIRGRDIMDLWDRICATLRTRVVTIEDLSRKRSMQLRLLYGVAYGQTWFGRWGYKFCHGSFGITEHTYQKAIEILSSHHLDAVIEDFKEVGRAKEIERIILGHQKMGGARLETVRDLLQHLLELKARHPFQTKTTIVSSVVIPGPCLEPPVKSSVAGKRQYYRNFRLVAPELMSRWSVRRLELTAQVIVDALSEMRAEKSGGDLTWVPRQDIRDAARLHIGDTGLIDFVLKSLGNCIVGDYVVLRATNPSTRVLEYSVKNIKACCTPAAAAADGEPVTSVGPTTARVIIDRDIGYVYKHVLEGYPTAADSPMRLAARAILDSKHFAKEWPFRDDEDEKLRFMCNLAQPSAAEEREELTRPPPPPELVVLPPHATMGELRTAGERAMQDTYCVLERFQAHTVDGLDGGDDELLFGLAQSGSHVWLRGCGVDLESKLRYEGGTDSWTVDCTCGARDDDGERMVACDVCEVWQHTRCGGIDDYEAVPPLFLCARCGSMLASQGIAGTLGQLQVPADYA